jgi:hypothetical protein
MPDTLYAGQQEIGIVNGSILMIQGPASCCAHDAARAREIRWREQDPYLKRTGMGGGDLELIRDPVPKRK